MKQRSLVYALLFGFMQCKGFSGVFLDAKPAIFVPGAVVKFATTNGLLQSGKVIDIDGDGVADGIDLDGNDVPEMLYIDINSDRAVGLDPNGDGIIDYYLFANFDDTLRMHKERTGGVEVKITADAISPTGFDTDGDTFANDTILTAIRNDAIAPTITATPAGGSYNGYASVTLTCSDNVACNAIAYTTNGSTPSFVIGTSTIKPGKTVTVRLDSSATLRFIARDAKGNLSSTTTENYTILPYSIGGTVSGLSGFSGTLVLRNNGGDDLAISENGSFNFATGLANGSIYNASVFTQPSGQTCSVANGSGVVASNNVTNITVTCTSNAYAVGGTVSGLASGTLVLQNNGSDDLALAANGSYAFSSAVSHGMAYDVTVKTNPTGLVCAVKANQGTIYASGVSNADVQCGSDTNWTQDAYVKASNSGATDEFGYSVAASGDFVVVGARHEDSSATTITNTDGGHSEPGTTSDSGAVYVFKRDLSGNWIQDAYLKPSNTGANDEFGYAVAISGSLIAVGAPLEDSNATTITNTDGAHSGIDTGATDSGAVYIFKRNAAGNWIQDAYIKASNRDASDRFGQALAISGSYLVVGAMYEQSNTTTIINTDGQASSDNSATQSGAAYIFRRDTNGNWIQDAYLKASNNEANDILGNAVAISGDIVVVAAYWERSSLTTIQNSDGEPVHPDNDAASSAGAVYVFKRDTSGNWIQDAYLKASNAELNDEFGYSVAISGTTIVVGAHLEDSSATTITNTDGSHSDPGAAANSGAVYVFKRDTSGNWIQDAYLKASNSGAGDEFGYAVAISGASIVVGAPFEDSSATSVINTDGSHSDPSTLTDAGAVYIFKRNAAGDWIQDAYLKASNSGAYDYFGSAVAISGGTVVGGAYLEDSSASGITNADNSHSDPGTATNSGAVYIFKAF